MLVFLTNHATFAWCDPGKAHCQNGYGEKCCNRESMLSGTTFRWHMAGHLTCNATILFGENSWSIRIFVLSVDIVDEPSFGRSLNLGCPLSTLVSPISLHAESLG